MTVKEYLERLDRIEERTIALRYRIELLCALKNKYVFEKYRIGEEYLCTYDIAELWDEYSVKLRKCIYFLTKYYTGMRNEIAIHAEQLNGNDNICISPSRNMEEAIFNFDAFILSACAVIDNEEKDYLAAYLKNTDVKSFYPSRKEIGLYWQLNLLRNRIVHHTGGRYINSELCQRYFDFSSHVRTIRIRDGHLYLECTQIDIHTSKTVQEVIKREIENNNRNNIFDELFPERKGKGKGKKNPVIILPNENIYFDHAYGGQWVAGAIQDFIFKIIQAFFVEFCSVIKNKSSIPELGIRFIENGQWFQIQIKDFFDVCDAYV